MTLAQHSPIVKSIVKNMIFVVNSKNVKFKKKELIDSTTIPPMSEAILLKKGFINSKEQETSENRTAISREKLHSEDNSQRRRILTSRIIIPQRRFVDQTNVRNPFGKRDLERSDAPEGFKESIIREEEPEKQKTNIEKQNFQQKPTLLPQTPQSQILPPQKPQPPKNPFIPINLLQNPPNYGKMNRIIMDPMVDLIECSGPDSPLLVVTAGRKQQTNIVLLLGEIKMLLESISLKTGIPLTRGVFRVSWDNLVINAVLVEDSEPKFVIKKIR